jgi:NAD(P)-dependent dehydrogenase (short-subunit alcohol dehydrogenase family)
MRLKAKTALITGGNSGIGLAAAPGASIILNGSIAATAGFPSGAGFYAASKAGILFLL